MDILILGGTQFIGRHVAESLLRAGHAVAVFTRGVSPDPLPREVERLHGDRDAGAAGLAALGGAGGRRWDACVDVSGYTPRQVRASAEALRDRVGRYVYVSAVMSYGDARQRPVTEDHPQLPPAADEVTEVDGQTYGPLKVANEAIVGAHFGARAVLLRPQIVVGPHDPTNRLAHWLQRAALGGEMLAPGDGSDHLQFIDVRDLARFVVVALESGLSGPFNLAGPRFTWARFMQLIGAVHPVWVGAAHLSAAGLTFMELPMYRPEQGRLAGLMEVSAERALAAGLAWTDTTTTIADVRAGLAGRPLDLALSLKREAALIAEARRQAAVAPLSSAVPPSFP